MTAQIIGGCSWGHEKFSIYEGENTDWEEWNWNSKKDSVQYEVKLINKQSLN